MNEYSEKDYRELNELSDKWQTEYESSIHFTELPDNQRVPAFFIISNFTDMMYNYHVQKPNEWEPDALEDVICDLFPRKISSDDDLYIAVEPVLTSYFEYLITKKHIKNGAKLIRRLSKSAPLMLKTALDSKNWSFSKQLVMSAKDQGVDLENESELQQYIQKYNESQIPQQPVVKSKIGRNTTCPCGSGKKYKNCCINL
jgi:hypothetical protein